MSLFSKGPQGDKRQRYRVGVSKQLTVSLREGDDWNQVKTLDLSATGIAIEASLEEAEGFGEGTTFELRFSLHGRTEVITTLARVANNVPFDGQQGPAIKVGMYFLEAAVLHAKLDPSLWRFFNRRQDYRVQPFDERPDVIVRWRDHELTGALGNICTQGLAVYFKPATRVLLLPGVETEIEFQLPDSTQLIQVVAKSIHREVHASSPHLGFAMDGDRSPDFLTTQALIFEFVVNCQRKELG